MANPYFQFKQFTVYQDRSAMKVCTDACLFGSWAAAEFGKWTFEEKRDDGETNDMPGNSNYRILDMGTGTGLLSLMLAQKLPGQIDAIEIDEGAFLQAKANVSASKWNKQITIIHADIRQFTFRGPYDLVIANPPFFENDLPAADKRSNMARHNETLRLEELLHIASKLLSQSGFLAMLLPYHREEFCLEIADSLNLFPFSMVAVKQTNSHNFFRSMIAFTKKRVMAIHKKELVIKDGNNYTSDFAALLKDYYLNI